MLSPKHDLRNLGSGVDSGDAGGARAPPEFRCSETGGSRISAYLITTSTSGFKKLSTARVDGRTSRWVSYAIRYTVNNYSPL